MATVNEVLKAVKAKSPRSAWDKGVKEYAIDMLNDVKEGYDNGGRIELTQSNYKRIILNGAEGYKEYSESGNTFIYDEDIAKRLCTPSEYMRLEARGFPDPNPRKDWIQVQARACFQASNLIKESIITVDSAKTKAKSRAKGKRRWQSSCMSYRRTATDSLWQL